MGSIRLLDLCRDRCDATDRDLVGGLCDLAAVLPRFLILSALYPALHRDAIADGEPVYVASIPPPSDARDIIRLIVGAIHREEDIAYLPFEGGGPV